MGSQRDNWEELTRTPQHILLLKRDVTFRSIPFVFLLLLKKSDRRWWLKELVMFTGGTPREPLWTGIPLLPIFRNKNEWKKSELYDPSCKKQLCFLHDRGWQRMLQSQVWNASWSNSFHLAGLWTLPQTSRNRWNNTKCKDKKQGKWCWKSNHEIQPCLMIFSIPREEEFHKTRRNLKGFGKHEEKIIQSLQYHTLKKERAYYFKIISSRKYATTFKT